MIKSTLASDRDKGSGLGMKNLAIKELKSFIWHCGLALGLGWGALAGVNVSGAEVREELLQEEFPFQGACIGAEFPANNVAMKGLAIRVGNGASMLFDTDVLRMAAGWTGGFITTHGVAFDGGHGGHPQINGEQQFGTPLLPGWSGAEGAFDDPREAPYGPIPSEQGEWKGLYVHGMDVVLSYAIRGTQIFEQPSSVQHGGQTGFVRTFKIAAPTQEALRLLVCEVPEGKGEGNGTVATLTGSDGEVTTVGAVGLPQGAGLGTDGNRILLKLPQGTPESLFKLVIAKGSVTESIAHFGQLMAGEPEMVDFKEGGEPHWPEAVETKGMLGTSKTSDGAYVTDSLTPPLNNPWNRRVRFGGLDFFSDGTRAALSTWDGDIWIVSGIDEDLDQLKWRRFASGMYETLGLAIVDDVIYTSGRDQLTRYHDLNDDGAADFYENFCNLYTSTEGFHEFVFDLQVGPEGNFYFAKAGPVQPGGRGFETISRNAGTLMKVSPDGDELEVVATGFRAPNGIGIGPNGQLTTGDNEGTWVPACPINWVEPGGFYGVEDTAHRQPVPKFNKPLCWLSHGSWDNSGGGQVWVPNDRWGPFEGELLHCSYGQCALYLVMKQRVGGGQMQGGVVSFPLRFTSSAMRPKFNPDDGQLYVAGFRGWQTTAANITGLDRVRYTGKPVYTVRELKVDQNGVHMTFTQPLDPEFATDPQNYAAERWNYHRSSNYGSAEYSVANPEEKGHDTVEITGAKLSEDGRTVTLEMADLKPVMQQLIRFYIRAADGTRIKQEVLHTIHEVPDIES